MKEINVILNNSEINYNIYISENFDKIGSCLDENKINGKILIVTDSNIKAHYQEEIERKFKDRESYFYTMQPGENYKTLNTVNEIYEKCMQNNFNRSSTIISIGGGVVGDTAGFAAATYMRGIKFIQVPTTIIGDVDSSIGGKVGVNHNNIKNNIGCFYHPKFIYVNTSLIKTLEKRHINSGIGEIIKYAVLFDKEFFNYLDDNASRLINLQSDVLNYIIRKCIMYKVDTVKNDIYDVKERQLLNLGHTMGHVIESMTGYSTYHGEAVAIGIMFAAALSYDYQYLCEDEMIKIFKLIKKYGLYEKFDFSDKQRIYSIMQHDKKKDKNGLKFILIKSIGNTFIESNVQEKRIENAFGVIKKFYNII